MKSLNYLFTNMPLHKMTNFTFTLTFLLMLPIMGYNQAPWKANPILVEKMSQNRPNTNYREQNVPDYQLPSILSPLDGNAINNQEAWEKQRKIHLDWFESQVFGQAPPTAYQMSAQVIQTIQPDSIMGILHKIVDLKIKAIEDSLTLRVHLFKKEHSSNQQPACLLINHRGSSMELPFPRIASGFFPVQEITDNGYVGIIFQTADIDPDSNNPDTLFQNGIHPLLDQERDSSSWGTLAAWAWGASRILDYLENDEWVDAQRVAVIGHSRGGKTALWAGASDQRFAAVYSNCSGAGGAAISRRRFGETLAQLNTRFPHWFCKNYHQYNDREHEQPIDAHTLLALIAPRPLYVVSADEDLWADPKGEYLSLQEASAVYHLYGYQDFQNQPMPSLNEPVHQRLGYHIRSGKHNLTTYDWLAFLAFLDLHFK